MMQSFTKKPVFTSDEESASKRYIKLFCALAEHLAEKPEREPYVTCKLIVVVVSSDVDFLQKRSLQSPKTVVFGVSLYY